MKITYSFLLFSSIALFSFGPAGKSCGQQGIKGYIYRVSGNQMPSPDASASKPTAMKSVLYIYELTHTSQVSQEGSFYKTISSKLVKEIPTDDSGYFKARLQPGWYSLFVKKGDLYYANIFDGKNNIHPVEVKRGEWKEENFKADYDAVY